MASAILTLWSVRAAVACCVLRMFVELAVQEGPRRERIARWLWTAGCGLYLIHVLAAFAFYHDWSHHAAVEHTARRTAELTGMAWGGGLYFNYVFTAVWLADVLDWWRRGTIRTGRTGRLERIIQVFFGFMILNATVVFGPPYWKGIAAAVAVVTATLVARKLRLMRANLQPPSSGDGDPPASLLLVSSIASPDPRGIFFRSSYESGEDRQQDGAHAGGWMGELLGLPAALKLILELEEMRKKKQ